MCGVLASGELAAAMATPAAPYTGVSIKQLCFSRDNKRLSRANKSLLGLTVAALGVVFGDIGAHTTSDGGNSGARWRGRSGAAERA